MTSFLGDACRSALAPLVWSIEAPRRGLFHGLPTMRGRARARARPGRLMLGGRTQRLLHILLYRNLVPAKNRVVELSQGSQGWAFLFKRYNCFASLRAAYLMT